MNFPTNDDWAYALGVEHLIRGKLHLCEWGTSSQILQLAWGAMWALVLGKSLGILKLSTLTAAALGSVFLNSILRILNVRANVRLIATLLLAANPLYLCLSVSFMTDVPYLCLMLLSFLLYVVAERDNSDSMLLAGSAAAAAAFLVRQFGILIPIGYCLHLLIGKRLTFKKMCLLWGLLILALIGYTLWFHFIHGPTWASENAKTQILAHLAKPNLWILQAVNHYLAAVLLIGFSTSPFALGFLASPKQFVRKQTSEYVPLNGTIAVIASGVIGIFLLTNGWMPHLGNTFGRTGLGLPSMPGTIFKASGIFGWPVFWILATLASAITSVCVSVVYSPVSSLASPLTKAALRIVAIPCLAQFILTFTWWEFYDRHTLIILPVALLIFSLCTNAWTLSDGPARAGVWIIVAISLASTKDYLAWNQARWKIGELAMNHGLEASQIANGFEWNGYWTYEKNMALLEKNRPLHAIRTWDWQRMNPYRVVTTFQPAWPGHTLLAVAPYWTPLARNEQAVYMYALTDSK